MSGDVVGDSVSARRNGLISIVIPFLNEEANLRPLHARLTEVLSAESDSYELILVDDGSADRSIEVALDLHSRDQRVKVLQFSRNFGHQAALSAGLSHAAGDAVITMDADLQHPPELIPDLLRLWRQGFEVVFTCRQSTVDAGVVKRLTSRLFYAMFDRLSNVQLPRGAADFRLLDRRVVEAFRTLDERVLFLRGLVSWMGFRQTQIPFAAPARQAAETRYSALRMLKFAVDGITSFSSVPLYLSAALGGLISFAGFAYAGYAVWSHLFMNTTVPGWTSVLATILVLGGIQLMALGLLGVYLGRIYSEVKGRPRYLIRQSIGFEPRNAPPQKPAGPSL